MRSIRRTGAFQFKIKIRTFLDDVLVRARTRVHKSQASSVLHGHPSPFQLSSGSRGARARPEMYESEHASVCGVLVLQRVLVCQRVICQRVNVYNVST